MINRAGTFIASTNAAIAFGFALACGGCAINPATGERELALISEEQEIELGRQSSQQVEQSIGLVENDALESYVAQVGRTLAARSERPELPWAFGVVDDPTPNAFALPGGYIYVTRGLVTLLTSEAELAAVLGHEIGHVTARHSVSQISRAQLAQLGLGLGTVLSPEIARLSDLLGTGLQVLFLKYGRDDERQSDELGFRYMLDAGYDVTEVPDVFTALLGTSELAGQSALPGWLASHPTERERIESARRRAAELDPAAAEGLHGGRDAYLDAIDGTVYGENPRNGFFRGDAFYHPELIFRFRVPADWQRQNLASTVQAVSPEQDAAVELSIVPAPSERAAAEGFFSSAAVVAVQSAADRINGKPAVLSEFRAESSGGIVRGYVAHIRHGELVYRLAGYAPEPAFPARAAELRDIVTSFSDIDDPEILEMQPSRVEIVTTPRGMTLAEFAEEFPSAIPIDELALINHVAVDTTIPAGTRLKRIVR